MSGLSMNEGHVKSTDPDNPMIAIEVTNGNFFWQNLASEERGVQKAFELRDLNVIIEKGKLVFIIGKVASGKSSILYSMMGEVKPFNPYPESDPRHNT
jgi:ABC-type siderophore export system fused ATPase/permease subunit